MSSDNNTFDPTRFASPSGAEPGVIGAKKVIHRIEVRTPNKQEFFCAQGEHQLQADVLEYDQVRYLIDVSMATALAGEFRTRNLTLCQNRQEAFLVLPATCGHGFKLQPPTQTVMG